MPVRAAAGEPAPCLAVPSFVNNPGYLPNCTEAQPCPIIGSRRGETFARDGVPLLLDDEIGPLPAPRWSRKAASAAWSTGPFFFAHQVLNSGHILILCRPKEGRDVCFKAEAMGEDQLELPILRSPDGRHLFWSFAGSVIDLETLQPLTAIRAIPQTPGTHFDFEFDRPGLTLASDGSLVSFIPDATGDAWVRTDNESASARFGILATASDDAPLHIGQPPRGGPG
jgi:hypothetical protein